MPLNRNACLDILTVDSFATTGPKAYSSILDKRRGYKFARKEKISTWELIEGVKNASSLCLSWYGSSKLEKKMLRYEYQQKLLLRHKHMNTHKELTYFKDKNEAPADMIEVVEPTVAVVVPLPPPPPPPVMLATPAAVTGNKKDPIKSQLSMPDSNRYVFSKYKYLKIKTQQKNSIKFGFFISLTL